MRCSSMHGFMPIMLSLWLVSAFAQADELKILTVDEPPSSFVTDDGHADGFAVDVVQAIQRRLGNTDPITFMPEIRVLTIAAQSPNVLLFGFSKTPEREQQYHMITLLLRKPWVLYGKAGSGIKVDSLDDARKIPALGVVRGDVRSIYLDKLGFTNLQKVPYHELNVKMLLSDRIQMLFYEPLGMAYACKKLGVPLDSFEEVYTAKTSDVYLMMSKQGTDPQLVKKWQQAAEALKQDGEFEKIAEKWSGIIYQQTGVRSEATAEALNF